jgi:hypothetical protein
MSLTAFYHVPINAAVKAEMDRSDGEVTLRIEADGFTMFYFLPLVVAGSMRKALEAALEAGHSRKNGGAEVGI